MKQKHPQIFKKEKHQRSEASRQRQRQGGFIRCDVEANVR